MPYLIDLSGIVFADTAEEILNLQLLRLRMKEPDEPKVQQLEKALPAPKEAAPPAVEAVKVVKRVRGKDQPLLVEKVPLHETFQPANADEAARAEKILNYFRDNDGYHGWTRVKALFALEKGYDAKGGESAFRTLTARLVRARLLVAIQTGTKSGCPIYLCSMEEFETRPREGNRRWRF